MPDGAGTDIHHRRICVCTGNGAARPLDGLNKAVETIPCCTSRPKLQSTPQQRWTAREHEGRNGGVEHLHQYTIRRQRGHRVRDTWRPRPMGVISSCANTGTCIGRSSAQGCRRSGPSLASALKLPRDSGVIVSDLMPRSIFDFAAVRRAVVPNPPPLPGPKDPAYINHSEIENAVSAFHIHVMVQWPGANPPAPARRRGQPHLPPSDRVRYRAHCADLTPSPRSRCGCRPESTSRRSHGAGGFAPGRWTTARRA